MFPSKVGTLVKTTNSREFSNSVMYRCFRLFHLFLNAVHGLSNPQLHISTRSSWYMLVFLCCLLSRIAVICFSLIKVKNAATSSSVHTSFPLSAMFVVLWVTRKPRTQSGWKNASDSMRTQLFPSLSNQPKPSWYQWAYLHVCESGDFNSNYGFSIIIFRCDTSWCASKQADGNAPIEAKHARHGRASQERTTLTISKCCPHWADSVTYEGTNQCGAELLRFGMLQCRVYPHSQIHTFTESWNTMKLHQCD